MGACAALVYAHICVYEKKRQCWGTKWEAGPKSPKAARISRGKTLLVLFSY